MVWNTVRGITVQYGRVFQGLFSRIVWDKSKNYHLNLHFVLELIKLMSYELYISHAFRAHHRLSTHSKIMDRKMFHLGNGHWIYRIRQFTRISWLGLYWLYASTVLGFVISQYFPKENFLCTCQILDEY